MLRSPRLRLVPLAVCALVLGATAGSASASAVVSKRCGTAQTGALLAPHWAVLGPEHISIPEPTAVRIWREIGVGVEGFHPTVADAVCGVAWSVAVRAASAWVRSPRHRYSLGIRTVGAGHNPYLGTFRCVVVRDSFGAAGTCAHAGDPLARRIVVHFRIHRQ